MRTSLLLGHFSSIRNPFSKIFAITQYFISAGKDVKFSSGNLFVSNHFDIISGISTGGLYILSEELCFHGDLNYDQIINISDIILLISIILGDDIPNAHAYCAGDLNNDTGFNILDISLYIHLLLN